MNEWMNKQRRIQRACIQHTHPPPAPLFRRLELRHIELRDVLGREPSVRVGAEATVGGRAVVVHGEDEVDGVAEREDHTLEAERVAEFLASDEN